MLSVTDFKTIIVKYVKQNNLSQFNLSKRVNYKEVNYK